MATTATEPPPIEKLALRTIAMPADSNPGGSVFGGWLMSQMDLAGATIAVKRAHGPVVTIAVDSMVFHQPVRIGDEVTVYGEITRVGTTSITVKLEAWVGTRFREQIITDDEDYRYLKVTQGTFTYVSVDPETKKHRPVPDEKK